MTITKKNIEFPLVEVLCKSCSTSMMVPMYSTREMCAPCWRDHLRHSHNLRLVEKRDASSPRITSGGTLNRGCRKVRIPSARLSAPPSSSAFTRRGTW